MSTETMTLVISISALVLTCLFVGKLLKTVFQLAILGGLLYLGWHFLPQLQNTACDMATNLAGPLSICAPR